MSMASAEPPAQRAGILYVDTSALLKLLVREAESTAIEAELLQWPNLATSVVTEVELPRAVARAREERPEAVIDGSLILQGVIASASIIELSDDIVAAARRGADLRRRPRRDPHRKRAQPGIRACRCGDL
jgi:uncharacterized protein with PIN domain